MNATDMLVHQNKTLMRLLSSVDLVGDHDSADTEALNFYRLRWSMMLEENEFLLVQLRNGTTERQLETFLRVPRVAVHRPGDRYDRR